MCKKMQSTEFRRMISTTCGKRYRVSNIFEFLKMTGIAIAEENGTIELDDDFEKDLHGMMSPIEIGDIVFVFSAGFYLVTDTHPSAINDGEHFRALAVTTNENGECVIRTDRSRLFRNFDAIRTRKSGFNMKEVEECSKSRHDAYAVIEAVNSKLSSLREQKG